MRYAYVKIFNSLMMNLKKKVHQLALVCYVVGIKTFVVTTRLVIKPIAEEHEPLLL
jgi:hypothetical protein